MNTTLKPVAAGVLALGLFGGGMGLGHAISDPTASEEYANLESENSSQETRIDVLETGLKANQKRNEELTDELRAAEKREDDLVIAEEALQQREADTAPADTTRSEQLYYQSGDPVSAGYPIIVDTAQIDSRVANAIKTPQAVALAPGVYVGYNPAVTDLAVYLESNVGDGDCAVRDLYAFGGGSCWNGVLASPSEPAP